MTDWPEILTTRQMRLIEEAAIASGQVSGATLMERAGAAAAEAIAARWPAFAAGRETALVLCGPGNNGGDGYVAARLLKARGWPVEVRALGEPQSADAKAAAALWDGGLSAWDAPLEARLYIDAMFGAGLARLPRPDLVQSHHWMSGVAALDAAAPPASAWNSR